MERQGGCLLGGSDDANPGPRAARPVAMAVRIWKGSSVPRRQKLYAEEKIGYNKTPNLIENGPAAGGIGSIPLCCRNGRTL